MADSGAQPLTFWLQRYDKLMAQRRHRWPAVFAACLFCLGLLCALWTLPVPAEMRAISPLLNWSTALMLAALVYYFLLSLPLALALLPLILVAGTLVFLLQRAGIALAVCAALLIGAALVIDLANTRQRSLHNLSEFVQLAILAPIWALHAAVQQRD